MLTRETRGLVLQHPVYSIVACILVMNVLLWQRVSAHTMEQDQTATFTLSERQGKCTPITGYGAHFPPGSTVIIAGPQINGRNVGDNVQINRQVAADGTFTVTLNPCPHQLVTDAGTFPISDGLQFTFTVDTPTQNGIGAAATYTVAGLGNPGIPNTGAPTSSDMFSALSIQSLQLPLSTVVLFVGAGLAALGGCLLLLERARHRGL